MENPVGGSVSEGKLPRRIMYIYATTCPDKMGATSKNSGHDVFSMRQENIELLDGIVWNEMKTL
ncbi:MAG: hypothetical protein EOP56_19800 [Sphingobacteriales bacterium]|nr:MAG: hypothetical protein EOP56_19800 [Sphingobacteriales bacterium]